MRRVLVCGGRDWRGGIRRDGEFVYRVLTQMHKADPFSVLIHGACKTGVDRLAHLWALANSVDIEPYPADWERHGRAAGPIRNREMLDRGKPQIVIAFPGGRGTANMLRQARDAGVPVMEPLPS